MEAIVDKVTKERKTKPGLVYIDSPALIQMVPVSCRDKQKEVLRESPWWQKLMGLVGILKKNKFVEVPNQDKYLILD